MKPLSLTLIFFLTLLKASDSLGQEHIGDSALIKLRSTISELKEKHHAPAVVVAIIHGKDIIHSEALGYIDIQRKTIAGIDSKFPIMSVTKTFTATMLMQLVEKGIVQLNDDVKKYVPEYKVKSGFPGEHKTTLFQLATHSSGLPRNSPADVDFTVSLDKWLLSDGKEPLKWFSTKNELLKSLQYVQLAYPPFEYKHHNDRNYSNLGYSVLGIALESASKTNYTTYVVNSILKPLKMMNSGFLSDSRDDTAIATGYWYNSGSHELMKVPAFKPNSGVYAGGMYSTARDLAKYISFQFDNSAANVLSEGSKTRMKYFKIGWKPAFPFVLHEGSIPGYRCIVVFNAETKIGWVILTNTSDFNFDPLNNTIAEIMVPVFRKKPVTDINQYAGIYKLNGGYGGLKIFVKNDSLYSTYLQEMVKGRPLRPDGTNRFKAESNVGYNIGYEFVLKEGVVTALKMGQFVWYKQ